MPLAVQPIQSETVLCKYSRKPGVSAASAATIGTEQTAIPLRYSVAVPTGSPARTGAQSAGSNDVSTVNVSSPPILTGYSIPEIGVAGNAFLPLFLTGTVKTVRPSTNSAA